MRERRKRILLTRPRAASDLLAATLAARGYDVLIEPLIDIVPTEASLPDLGTYDALIFTSANGVTAFADRSGDRCLCSYAVGGATADALLADGFSDVRVGTGDAPQLADLIARERSAGARLLHIGGKDISHDFNVLLSHTHLIVDRIVLYEAVAATAFSKRLVEALYACTIDVVLLFSARTATLFATLIDEAGLADSCRKMDALCLSPRVLDAVSHLPWRSADTPARPTAEAMLALLDRPSG
jgi:uroporphyrinogen-III synthase